MFDFEQEIEPVLQILVGKALEAARYEILFEEEIVYLHGRKINFR